VLLALVPFPIVSFSFILLLSAFPLLALGILLVWTIFVRRDITEKNMAEGNIQFLDAPVGFLVVGPTVAGVDVVYNILPFLGDSTGLYIRRFIMLGLIILLSWLVGLVVRGTLLGEPITPEKVVKYRKIVFYLFFIGLLLTAIVLLALPLVIPGQDLSY
jgi:hypothetical protein